MGMNNTTPTNTIKAKTSISCETCGCKMRRTKSIKVTATTKEGAINEGREKFRQWVGSLSGQNCKTCQSIINDLAA